MPEFTQSWAFTFIVGVICFALGFALAIILAASSKGSRMEERMKFAPNLICKSCEYWKGRCEFNGPCPRNSLNNNPSIKIATKNNPRTD